MPTYQPTCAMSSLQSYRVFSFLNMCVKSSIRKCVCQSVSNAAAADVATTRTAMQMQKKERKRKRKKNADAAAAAPTNFFDNAPNTVDDNETAFGACISRK